MGKFRLVIPKKKGVSKQRRIRDAAFRQIHKRPPKRVFLTSLTHGIDAGRAQQTAIALDLARRNGARIPK